MSHADAVFEITSWDEKPYQPIEGGGKLTRASVSKLYTGDITGEAMSESLMCYRADGTAEFLGYERIVGAVGGKQGSFVLEATGTFANGTARCECTVVEGSGTGDLARLSGKGSYAATHADYPKVKFSMDYRIES